MKKLKLLFISLVMTVVLPGTSVLAEIGYMRDVNTGCGEIAVECSSCHNLLDYKEDTPEQDKYKSDGGIAFCSDSDSWVAVRPTKDDLLLDAQTTTDAYFADLFALFSKHLAQTGIPSGKFDPVTKQVTDPSLFTDILPQCSEIAPLIASNYSKEKGQLIRRVTNRTRNARNTPDSWEAKQLEDFENMAKQGKDRTTFLIKKPDHTDEVPSLLTTKEFEATAIVQEEDIEYFRYMRSITLPPVTMLPCLKCHGTFDQLAPGLVEALEDENGYPYDMALGYKAGDIRGAWTIKIPVVEGKDD